MKHSNCLICNSTDLKNIRGYEKAHLCKCRSCGFVFSVDIPSPQDIATIYNNYERKDYLSPITIKRYNELLDKFEVYRKTNKILDIGCGIGHFLEVAKKRGWEVYGTEFTEKAVDICSEKEIQMKQGVLNPQNYSSGMFDIITSFEVIEHINNPKDELLNFHSILREGGLVYITTPNFNSLLRYFLKETYNIITYPEHLCYYTKKTLNKIFNETGFEKLKIETKGLSLTRFKTSKYLDDQLFISPQSDDEKIRNKIESKWYLKFIQKMINLILTKLSIGDSLKGWFIKKSDN